MARVNSINSLGVVSVDGQQFIPGSDLRVITVEDDWGCRKAALAISRHDVQYGFIVPFTAEEAEGVYQGMLQALAELEQPAAEPRGGGGMTREVTAYQDARREGEPGKD